MFVSFVHQQCLRCIYLAHPQISLVFQDDSNPDRYLKWAHGFVVVYSINNRVSYDVARSYVDSIVQYQRQCNRDMPVALVGNKMDLERYR